MKCYVNIVTLKMIKERLKPVFCIIKNISLSIVVIFLSSTLFGQTEHCGTMEVLSRHIAEDPSVITRMQQMEAAAQQYQHSDVARKSSNAVVTIPVVVHVVYKNADENISEKQILSQIEVLNKDYRRLNADTGNTPAMFKSIAADVQVEFCMAVVDPFGNPTNGITRTSTTATGFTTNDDVKFTTKGGIEAWPADDYLNIWTCDLKGGILGYAQLPNSGPPSTDGVVIGYKFFGTQGSATTPFNLGRTTTHEVGHWLGLFHIWGFDGCGFDDQISDTPQQDVAYYGCPNFPQSSCNSEDMFMNYMDYTNDACMNIFTKGQASRMQSILNTARSSILTSKACQSLYNLDALVEDILVPSSDICTGRFRPLIILTNGGNTFLQSATINFKVDGFLYGPFNWTGSLSLNESDTISLPVINVTQGNHLFTATVTQPNNGIDEYPANNSISTSFDVSYLSNAMPPPFQEGFEDLQFVPQGWVLENPDSDRTWMLTTNVGGFGLSDASVYFDNNSLVPDPTGTRDALITPEIDLSNSNFPSLTFNVAYARRSNALSDSLIILFSVDCGDRWIPIYAKGGLALATAGDRSFTFIPSHAEWRKEFIDLNFLAGNGSVQFKFENVSDRGNNIYLDDINLESAGVGVSEFNLANGIEVYPSPVADVLTIDCNLSLHKPLEITIFDVLGRSQRSESMPIGQRKLSINLSRWQNGIYFVRFKIDNLMINKKILINTNLN